MSKYLIVVDYQNDFITGALKNEDAIAIRSDLMEAVRNYVSQGYHLIFTRDTHYDNYMDTMEGKHLPVPHCLIDSEGWQIDAQTQSMPECADAVYVNKNTFGKLDWEPYIAEDVTDIVLCGVCTDICVVSNAIILKTLYPNAEVYALKDCCAGLTPEKHQHALDVMASCQINII